MEEFLIMGEFTHSWNHVGEFSAKRVTTSSFAGTTKPILLGKKKIIILLIPQNLASAAESFVFPSSGCLGYISCLASSPWCGAACKDHSGYDSGKPPIPVGLAIWLPTAVIGQLHPTSSLPATRGGESSAAASAAPVVGSACRGSVLSRN